MNRHNEEGVFVPRISFEAACRERTRPEALWEAAGFPPRFVAASLGSYEVGDSYDAQSALEWAATYAHQFDEALRVGRSALFCGKTGTGKTHLAIGIGKHIIQTGCSVIYTTTQRALREVKDTWGVGATCSHSKAIAKFTDPDLLIMDEVGVQFGTDAERIILFDILGERYDNVRPTILISNLPKQDVGQFLGDRIVDRMRENGGKLIVFDWESHRGPQP
jgi:DNA replication protein DnaC